MRVKVERREKIKEMRDESANRAEWEYSKVGMKLAIDLLK